MFTPFATRPAQPMYCRLAPAVRFALLLLTGLVQRPHPQRLVPQRLDHEPPHHALSLVVVPHRVIEQSLHPIRRPVSRVLGERPPILARQITHQPGQVLPGLLKRLRPRETWPQPAVQHRHVRHRPLTLYYDSRSRLRNFLRHNLMIMGRLLP